MTDATKRLPDMDEEGIDVAVIFGTSIALMVNGMADKPLAAAICHAVNRWLAEEYIAPDPKRLKGVGLIPVQDPPAAVKELEYLGQQRGIVTAMLPTNVYGINLGHRMFDPVYAAAQEIGMPLSVHPQTEHDGQYGVWGVMGAGSERMEKYSYVHMTSFPFECMIALMHMIGEGAFDRYPKLKVGFMEGACGWAPFWAERLDEHFEKLRPQWPLCQRKPSEIIRSSQVALPARGLSSTNLSLPSLVKSTLLAISQLETTSHKLRRWRHCHPLDSRSCLSIRLTANPVITHRGAYDIVSNEPDLSPPRIHPINKHEDKENEYELQKTIY